MRTRKAVTLDRQGRPRRAEIWSADHAGFHIERLEEPGTPWVVTLVATGESCWRSWPTLAEAKASIDSGETMRLIEADRSGQRCPPPT